jgi:hypothetical protein
MGRKKKEESLNVTVSTKEMKALAHGTKGWKRVEKERPKFANKNHPVYQKVFAEHVFRLNLLGATIVELADFFHVTEAVIYQWRKKHPEFREAFEKGKSIADSRVVERLYQRAIGYSHPETKVFMYRGQIIREEVTKHYPPDTGAACFWLKNRRRGEWKDKHEHEIVQQRVLDSVQLENVGSETLAEIVKAAGGPEFELDWKEEDQEEIEQTESD